MAQFSILLNSHEKRGCMNYNEAWIQVASRQNLILVTFFVVCLLGSRA